MKQFTKQNSSLCSLPGKIDFKSTILFTQKEENLKKKKKPSITKCSSSQMDIIWNFITIFN